MTREQAIDRLIKIKELGISQIEIELMMRSGEKSINVPDKKAEEIIKPMSVLDELDDDEILFWSSPYGLELEAKKELQQKHKKEEEDKK